MIPRYEQKEISLIWDESSKFSYFLKVELALLRALENAKKIPEGIAKKTEHALINHQRVHEIELEVKHDVIAFTQMISEQLSPDVARYFHYGVTSSDIIDTALTLQIKDSLTHLLAELKALRIALKELSEKTLPILSMGRSHGMFAEPLSFSQRWLTYYSEFSRREEELAHYFNHELTGIFSGAVGNYTILTPEIEVAALQELGLLAEPISTQIIPRDRIAKLVTIIGLLACTLERLSIEIRHLHRSDVKEVSEGFSKGQKGSSTMPHKKNPISSENISGLARLLRSYTHAAYDNTLLWHERDISHSSCERMMMPDLFGIALYALKRMKSTIQNLEVHVDEVENKVKESRNSLSSFYLHALIDRTNLSREKIYKIVQEATLEEKDEQKIKERLEKECAIQLPAFSFNDQKFYYAQVAKVLLERTLRTYPL